MCTVSMLSDYYRGKTIGVGWPPLQRTQPYPTFDEETKKLLREALERLDKIDKRLGDIECKDKEKAEFMKAIGYNEGSATAL